MQTRNQFLAALTVVETLPESADLECPICTDDYTNPVALSCNHIFCRDCIIQWFNSMAGRNTCPKCRQALFTFSLADRGPVGQERIYLIANALHHSGLTNADGFDYYGCNLALTPVAVQRAASEAYIYLASEYHADIENMYVDMKDLGPQITAMANLLRGYATAAGRPYNEYQKGLWKQIVHRMLEVGIATHGDSIRDPSVMGRGLKMLIRESFADEQVDIRGGRFFEGNANVDSASGDLDVLMQYFVYQSAMAYARRQQQKDEGTLAWASMAMDEGLRRLGRALFGPL